MRHHALNVRCGYMFSVIFMQLKLKKIRDSLNIF